MATIKVVDISMHGVQGEFRANSEQLGWRGTDGSVAACPIRTVLKAEWLEGKLRVLYEDEQHSQQLLPFDGFDLSSLDLLQGHLSQHAGVSILNRGPGAVAQGQGESKNYFEASRQGAFAEGQPPTLLQSLASSGDRGLASKRFSREVRPEAFKEPRPEANVLANDEEFASSESVNCRVSMERDGAQRKYRDSILEGWVMKQSKYLKRWNQRYLVLTPTLLATFKEAGDPFPTECVELSKHVQVITEASVDFRGRVGDATDMRRAIRVAGDNTQYTLLFKIGQDAELWAREIRTAKCLCD